MLAGWFLYGINFKQLHIIMALKSNEMFPLLPCVFIVFFALL